MSDTHTTTISFRQEFKKKLQWLFGCDKLDDPKPPQLINSPAIDEIACLYSELGEHAEIDTIKQQYPSVAAGAPGTTIYAEVRTEDNKLVGVARASNPSGSSPGIIYDIAVKSDYAGKNVAWNLVNELRKTRRDLRGYPARVIERLDRELSTIRILFAIALTLGLQKLVEAGYFLWFEDHEHLDLSRMSELGLTFICLAISLLGLRFFWAVGNIRRFVLWRIEQVFPPNLSVLLFLHIPLLFGHAILFFVLGRLALDLCKTASFERYADPLIVTYSGLLLLNAVALFCLRWGRCDSGIAEKIWIRNNLCVGLLVLLLRLKGPVRSELELIAFFVLFFGSSVFDLKRASSAYLLGTAFHGS